MHFDSIDRIMTNIRIADYTKFPGGRYRRHGNGSGEEFRETILGPALESENKVTVYLDDVAGYPASFLEEAFGGLVREKGYSLVELERVLTIKAENDLYSVYSDLAWEYIQDAANHMAEP